MRRLRKIALRDPDCEIDLATGHCRKTVTVCVEIASHQGEKIGRLRKWVVPLSPVATGRQFAAAHWIAVTQQNGKRLAIRFHPDVVAAEHIGPIGKESDPPEPFSLTLCAKETARCIEAHQLGVGCRVQLDFCFNRVLVAT